MENVVAFGSQTVTDWSEMVADWYPNFEPSITLVVQNLAYRFPLLTSGKALDDLRVSPPFLEMIYKNRQI